MNWLAQNAQSLNVLTSVGTLLIWLVYAQLLYLGFRRQRQPRLIINRGKRKDISALCIISNMSAEPVFLEYIIAELETSQGTITMDVTDFEQDYSEGDEVEGQAERSDDERRMIPVNVRENTRQGPLESGGFLHIGSFMDIIQRLARDEGIELKGGRPTNHITFHRLKIQIIGVYGPEDLPIAAERSFHFKNTGQGCALIPGTWDTKRQSSNRQRRKLRQVLADLNDANFSSSSSFRRVD